MDQVTVFAARPIKMYKLLLLVAAAIAVANAEPLSSSRTRMIGGRSATIEQYPYVVSLEDSTGSYFLCAGSIVSRTHVLTSAECARLLALQPRGRIRAGSARLGRGGSVHEVEATTVHEGYNGYPANDIGLVKVSPAFALDESRQTIELFSGAQRPGARATVAGWGPNTLLGATGQILECSLASARGLVCSGDGDSRAGDQAAPLAVDGRLAGVSIRAPSDGPGLYTEVAHHRDWIAKHSDA